MTELKTTLQPKQQLCSKNLAIQMSQTFVFFLPLDGRPQYLGKSKDFRKVRTYVDSLQELIGLIDCLCPDM